MENYPHQNITTSRKYSNNHHQLSRNRNDYENISNGEDDYDDEDGGSGDDVEGGERMVIDDDPDRNNTNLGTKSAQSWRNVRAVMAYYCSLRKIKRNGALNNIYFIFKFVNFLILYLKKSLARWLSCFVQLIDLINIQLDFEFKLDLTLCNNIKFDEVYIPIFF